MSRRLPVWLRFRLVADRARGPRRRHRAVARDRRHGVLVRREDGGPGFITVTRVGRDGRPFRMWKLRSMRAARPDGTADGLTLSGAHDDRITAIGRHLRAYHFDELPQLYNVVRGEMGILGPRPETPEFVDLDDPMWQDRARHPAGHRGPDAGHRQRLGAQPHRRGARRLGLPLEGGAGEARHRRSGTSSGPPPSPMPWSPSPWCAASCPAPSRPRSRSAVFAAVPESLVVRDFIRARKRRMAEAREGRIARTRARGQRPGLITGSQAGARSAPRLGVGRGRAHRWPHVGRSG